MIDVIDADLKIGNIVEILDRKNQLIRPAVSNIDQALVIFAATKPEPNLNLLDRFLITMYRQEIPTIICFNKMDIAMESELEALEQVYKKGKYPVLFTSVACESGVEEVRRLLLNRTTVLAGPSGVGKSSMINCLIPEANMETGSISQKIDRGKHTTRHTELFCMEGATYLMDTPGFSSLFLQDIEKEELKNYFPEFLEYEGTCRFGGCMHLREPNCAVKEAVESGKISKVRYENYVLLYDEMKEKKKYK